MLPASLFPEAAGLCPAVPAEDLSSLLLTTGSFVLPVPLLSPEAAGLCPAIPAEDLSSLLLTTGSFVLPVPLLSPEAAGLCPAIPAEDLSSLLLTTGSFVLPVGLLILGSLTLLVSSILLMLGSFIAPPPELFIEELLFILSALFLVLFVLPFFPFDFELNAAVLSVAELLLMLGSLTLLNCCPLLFILLKLILGSFAALPDFRLALLKFLFFLAFLEFCIIWCCILCCCTKRINDITFCAP